jgi:hypothetical protein
VAKAAGVGARTVYRYSPAQADLLAGCWLKLRERSRTVFPVEEDEIVDKLGEMYRAFDDNERLVRAVFQRLHSALFWSMLHDRGGLSKDEAIDAASWAARTLLRALRKEGKKEREGKHKWRL